MKHIFLAFLLMCAPVWAQHPLTVRVLDAAGAPIPNAQVEVRTWGEGAKPIPAATTDATGAAIFSLPQKPDEKRGTGNVVVAAKGFAFAGALIVSEKIEIQLETGATWRGKVLDEAGKPLEGAKIRVSGAVAEGDWERVVWLRGETLPLLYTTQSGADGSFQIEDLPAKMGLTYGVTHPRFAIAVGQDVPVGDEEIIKLTPGGGVRGRVLDVEGKPLPKISVYAAPIAIGEGGNKAVTEENGNFTIESLGAGEYRVGARVLKDAKFVLPSAASVRVAVGKTSDIPDLRAVTGVEIRGIVRDAATQKPLAGASLIAQQKDDTSAYNTSDAAGRFVLRVVPGNTKVYVSNAPTGYLRATEQKSAEAEAATPEIVFDLQKAAKISGVTVDEAGKPIAARLKVGWEGEIESEQDGKWEYTLTDNNAIRLGGGEDESGYFEVVSPDKIEIPSRGAITIKVRKLAWNTLAGRVVALDGTPLAGVKVEGTFYVPMGDGMSTSATQSAVSDAQGRFVLPKIRAGQGLKISGKKAGLEFQKGGEVAKDGAAWTTTDLVFAALDRKIEGTTAPDARVVAAGRETRADATGNFVFEALPSGDIPVFAAKDGQFGAALNAAGRIELQKQPLQGVDEELAREIWSEVVRDAEAKQFYALGWVKNRLVAGGDTFEAQLQNARAAKNRDMALLGVGEKWDGKSDVAALIGALEEIKAPDYRLYALLSAATKSDDQTLGARALQEVETVVGTPEKEAWWREMNFYRAAVVAEKFDSEKAGSKALNRAIAYTLKNHGEKSEFKAGSQTKTGRDDMFRLQAGVVAAGSPALLRQLLEAIEPGSGYDIWARAEAIPVVAKTHGAQAALPFLDELEKMPEPTQQGERRISNMKPTLAFGQAARPVIALVGQTSPEAALALARRVKSETHLPRALANAARFQKGEVAAQLWREAVEIARAEEAPRMAAQAWELDPQLGAQLFEIARGRIESDSKQQWSDNRSWAAFAFYFARVDAAEARLILEKRWGAAMAKKAEGQELQAIARAMSAIDARRAWEMARQIPVEDKNFWSLETRRKIGQYLAASEEQRRDFPFDRWGATDTWDAEQGDW